MMLLQFRSPSKRVFSIVTFLAIAIALVIASGCSKPVAPVKIFEDVTDASGLGSYVGMTHGVYWGDFDGDGLPDVYVTNHLNKAQLFHNLGNGRFEDVTNEYFEEKDLGGDKHGAAWAHVNNGERLDLVQLTGAVLGLGQEPKRLLMNRGNKFEDVATAMGVVNPFGRARMPLWVDLNRDGKLDLFEGAEARFDEREPPFAFLRQGDRFTEEEGALKFASRSPVFCIVTELNSDAHQDLVCKVEGKNVASQIFDVHDLPAKELKLLPATAFEDVAAGDFDNSGNISLFLARKNPAGPVAFGGSGDKNVIADVWIEQANMDKPWGFSFKTSGKVNFRIASAYSTDMLSVDRIYIGEQGTHPAGLEFSLARDTPGVSGTAAVKPGEQSAIHVGFTAPDTWKVTITAARNPELGAKSKPQQVTFSVTSTERISEIAPIGDVKPEEAPQRLFMNRGGKLVDESDKRGVNKRPIAAVNAVAGDFNNDGLLDLFVVGSGEVGKQENMLLLNRGDGYFDLVADAGGASGPRTGVGDSVTTADYDRRGCLDLLVSSGGSMGRSLGIPSNNGGYRLYRNLCNTGNHWLEIDLEGTTSNRDAIGARVRLTAGGATQTRIQDGGTHHRGQNHSRLHFGLGKNARIDKVSIEWPSGTLQDLKDVAVDQIVRIKEPAK